VRAIFGLRDNRLECEACLDNLPAYVEAEAGGYAHRVEFRAIKRHVLLCSNCYQTYLDLLTIAIADQRDELPKQISDTGPDLEFLSGAAGHE
jgi:hypothetical protein